MSSNFLTQNFGDEDEESDNDFNPGAEQGSDAEAEDDVKPGKVNGDSSPRRQQSDEAEGHGDDDEDDEKPGDNGEDDEGEGEDLAEDDEEEDEENEEEDGIRSRPRKRRRGGLNQFFEEEAEVDEDDDDLEADEEGLGNEFIEDTHPDDDLPAEADQDDRRHRELDRKRQLEASLDAELQAEQFRERYGRRTAAALSGKGYIPQNLLMPDVSDPSIFGVKCREGKEKEIVRAINVKFVQRQARDPMRIFSAFERGEGAMKGYIFVEARNKVDVEHALKDVHDVYPHSKMNLVPMKEMPDLLRVTKTKELEPGAYVRIRKGIYTGDLAVVEETVPNGLDVTVRVVPRLTYGFDEDQPKAQTPAGDKRKRPGFAPAQNLANRPPARLFSEAEARKRHSRFLQQVGGLTKKNVTYKGDAYEDGFLIKNFKLNQLQTENVQPKLEETQLFTRTGQDGSETLDLETLKHSLHDKSTAESSYQVGDEVEVFSGEQKGVIGRTERVTGNIVSIRASEGDLKDQLVEVPVRNLRKCFRDGDNVVVGGASKYRDQVGTVIAIENDKVTILSHDNQMEFTVFSKDLRIASGAGASTERSPFEVRDLVQLTATTFGCVVGADPQTVKVMDQNGSIETRLPSSLSKIAVSRHVVAVDKNGSEIRAGDTVKEAGGEGKSGNVLHIYRNYLFAHDRSRMVENAGIWVARSSNVVGRSARSGAPLTDLTKMNPALMQATGPNGAPMGPPQRPGGMDRLIRKKVKITRGPYKGHRGTVKDTTINEARIELESKNKTVNISKGEISVIDPNTNEATPYAVWAGRRPGGPPSAMRTGPSVPGSRVPDGARTPFAAGDGGRTPAWGGASARTPAWGGPSVSALDSGRTPSWRASGSMTSYGGAGGNTTYGGAGNYSAGIGSRTPAWSSSARTPSGADHGFGGSSGGGVAFDAFAAGSRTPHGASGASVSRTPAWSGPSSAASAPTPAARAFDAPTPAAAMNAPTPAFPTDDGYTPAYSAPTPGAGFGNNASMDAPTPGFARAANTVPLNKNRLAVDAPTPAGGPVSAPTPAAWGGGAYDAPTPAVGGGPRYAEDDDDE